MTTRSHLPYVCATHEGHAHPVNEDSSVVFDTPGNGVCLVVCDGMGGMGRGDEASRVAVDALQHALTTGVGAPDDRICKALIDTDITVRERMHVPGETTPGATAVAALVEHGRVTIGWVGDSRAYHLRGRDVVTRTRDHKLVNELIDAGELTEAEAKVSTLAHVITRALGGRPPGKGRLKPEATRTPWLLHRGDCLVLCSDGLSDLAEDDEIAAIVAEHDLDAAAEALVQLALDRGGHDNITLIVARWDGPSITEDDVGTPIGAPDRDEAARLRLASGSTWEPDADPMVASLVATTTNTSGSVQKAARPSVGQGGQQAAIPAAPPTVEIPIEPPPPAPETVEIPIEADFDDHAADPDHSHVGAGPLSTGRRGASSDGALQALVACFYLASAALSLWAMLRS